MGHTGLNGSHLEIWVTIGKMGYIWENESHFINMGQSYQHCRTWKYGSHWAKWVTLKIWVTIGKMGHIWENESHFINMGHTYQNYCTWKYESH